MAASPSSSPRLPSPPPIAEDQLGPQSPVAAPDEQQNPFEGNASRRIRPGSKAIDMALGPPLLPLADIDSPFQLTEHLKSLHSASLRRDGSSTISPIDRETAMRLAQPPEGVDRYLWLYELCRLLCKEINAMIVALFQDDPPCSAQTCNEMRASEWQYLCAVHDPPKPCCAIDYCCHTLDWTNHVLTSQKNFPSRLTVGADSGSGHAQLRQLTNIFRRVYRIFAHAWFQHRDMYWRVELKSGLYVFFKTVCDVYNLIPEDNYTVPPEAEGIEPPPAPKQRAPTILKRSQDELGADSTASDASKGELKPASHPTQRHRHTPSVGSESITTVLEEAEEDEDKAAKGDETVILSAVEAASLSGPVVAETELPDDEHTAGLSSEPAIEPSETTTETESSEPKTKATASTPITAIPVISVETAPESEAPEISPSSAAGEKAESTTSTDSNDSWQVVTDESQSASSDSATEIATESEEESAKKSDSSVPPKEKESVPEPSHPEEVSEPESSILPVQDLPKKEEPKTEKEVAEEVKPETVAEKVAEKEGSGGETVVALLATSKSTLETSKSPKDASENVSETPITEKALPVTEKTEASNQKDEAPLEELMVSQESADEMKIPEKEIHPPTSSAASTSPEKMTPSQSDTLTDPTADAKDIEEATKATD